LWNNYPSGFKTGEQISLRGGYVGGGLQMQTDLAADPAGNVWVMNNWQDIDSCFGTPPEPLSTRCGGQGVVIFYGQTSARTADRAGASALTAAPLTSETGPGLARSVREYCGPVSPDALRQVLGSPERTGSFATADGVV
jgi:hypothetical protein